MKRFVLSFISIWFVAIASAQTNEIYVEQPITFNQYLKLIEDNNLDLAAEKLNVDISKANIRTARTLPDPELTIEGTDNGERKMQMGYEIEASLDWTLELGGKRRSRVELAKSESELAISLLEDYYRGLRANATLEFLSSLRNENLYHTQLEARTMMNDLLAAETEWRNGMLDLEVLVNKQMNDTILKPVGNFEQFNRDFLLADLIVTAQNNRSDLVAAYQNKDVAQKIINLERANRKIDLGLSLKVAHATYAHNEVAPTPAHTPISVGVSIPLKFSNRNNSDLKVARFQHQQADYQYAQIEK